MSLEDLRSNESAWVHDLFLYKNRKANPTAPVASDGAKKVWKKKCQSPVGSLRQLPRAWAIWHGACRSTGLEGAGAWLEALTPQPRRGGGSPKSPLTPPLRRQPQQSPFPPERSWLAGRAPLRSPPNPLDSRRMPLAARQAGSERMKTIEVVVSYGNSKTGIPDLSQKGKANNQETLTHVFLLSQLLKITILECSCRTSA